MPQFSAEDGTALHYTEHGDPRGRPVVLIAGFKAAATTWKSQQQTLAAAGWRVISFDRRGHGQSEAPDAGATMQQHGADLGHLLVTLGLDEVSLVGGSQGASTIWSYVSQHGERRLRAIVSVDQTPKMLNDADWRYGFYGYDQSNRDTYFAETIPDPGAVKLTSKGPVRIARLLKALGGEGRREMTRTELALLHDHAVADWRPTIGACHTPTLFVAGRESEFWPAEHAAASAALAPRGESHVVEHAGHPVNIEQPKVFDELLVEWLGRG